VEQHVSVTCYVRLGGAVEWFVTKESGREPRHNTGCWGEDVRRHYPGHVCGGRCGVARMDEGAGMEGRLGAYAIFAAEGGGTEDETVGVARLSAQSVRVLAGLARRRRARGGVGRLPCPGHGYCLECMEGAIAITTGTECGCLGRKALGMCGACCIGLDGDGVFIWKFGQRCWACCGFCTWWNGVTDGIPTK
jgi:hypothetical protein